MPGACGKSRGQTRPVPNRKPGINKIKTRTVDRPEFCPRAFPKLRSLDAVSIRAPTDLLESRCRMAAAREWAAGQSGMPTPAGLS